MAFTLGLLIGLILGVVLSFGVAADTWLRMAERDAERSREARRMKGGA
jgi:preprotein translocase subunit SecF